ncbi:hypothetical protein ABZU94_07320 [Streptomyces mirabilis]|uniref:hypothetical protein n=1 Tax=Streptomyces sp. NPDC005388 TaxID=3156717 RepID=UPI00339F3817
MSHRTNSLAVPAIDLTSTGRTLPFLDDPVRRARIEDWADQAVAALRAHDAQASTEQAGARA